MGGYLFFRGYHNGMFCCIKLAIDNVHVTAKCTLPTDNIINSIMRK